MLGNKKASSSGSVKPPTADELLEHYTVEQLRAHFLALAWIRVRGLQAQALRSRRGEAQRPARGRPGSQGGTLLTNVFNRLARSCFYEAQKNFEGWMPLGEVSPEVRGA